MISLICDACCMSERTLQVSEKPISIPLFMDLCGWEPEIVGLKPCRCAMQSRAAGQDPDIVSRSWGYPASLQEYNYTHQGCLLHDVVSSNFPFTDIFEEPPAAEGYMHYEVLAYTSPSNVTYTYDNMQSSSSK